MPAYTWKSGSRIKADAQKCGELFKQLSETEEGLTARTLLDANRPDDAPLHNEYEWNDDTAADNWRLHQSRHFMNSICVSVDTSDSADRQIRAFHITTEESKYEPIETIVRNETKHSKLLDNAKLELKAFQRKYEMLSELEPIFKAIKEVTHE